jgi:predicted DNA-binding transcriptional regulator AlpA
MTIETIVEQARVTPSEQLPEFLGKLETARAVAYARLQAPAPLARPDDQLIAVGAAAALLCVSRSYLYQHSATLPFTVRVGKKVLFSTQGIQEYVKQRQMKRR